MIKIRMELEWLQAKDTVEKEHEENAKDAEQGRGRDIEHSGTQHARTRALATHSFYLFEKTAARCLVAQS